MWNNILEKIYPATAPLVKKLYSSWEKTHKSKLTRLAEIHEDHLERLNKLYKRELTFYTLWQELEVTLQKYLEWTKTLQYLDDRAAASLWSSWKEHFPNLLNDLPVSYDIPIPDGYWENIPGAPFKIRLWKWFKKRQHVIKERRFRIMNYIRILLRKPPLQLSRDHRTVALHSFFEMHLSLPIATFLLQERERFLQQVAIQLQQLHQDTEKMVYELLNLEGVQDLGLTPDSEVIMSRLQKVHQQSPAVEVYLGNMSNLEAESLQRLVNYLEEWSQQVQDQWEYAGTFALPNTRFDEVKIAEHWELLEKELAKSRQAWFLHFQGEQGDWKKDLEMFLLQLQSLRICVETIQSLDQKVSDQILPTFIEPGNMISESLEKFQEAGTELETKLKNLILMESRSMLRSLRQNKLPQMMDAVLQAQVEKALENYLLRIKQATERLADRHIILRERDLNTLRPRSKVMEIPLKELIFTEIFSELAQKHEKFSAETSQKLQQILRDISELDQIVEFNLLAALDLLQQDQEPGTHGDAQTVVVDGLGRASNQINDLIKTNRQIVEQGQELLSRVTFEYGKQIQGLADNEKIIGLKIRCAKAKTKEKIRNYRDTLLQTIKTTLPSILGFLSDSISRMQTSYLRFRKITGLAPTTTNVQEALSRFIAERQNQIAKLPYVYQRLFRIEPLTDERLFEGRLEEMKRLKEEFALWSEGQYGVTALVGEKGSGRTTLIHFATQEIYNKFPLTVIDLKEMTIRTEEGLMTGLKSIFRFEEEFVSIDALENKLNTQESQQIIIVEDLQNLYIKSVDGFDVLERFLLFVSRTHKQIYWIMTCSLYSWRYLDKVLDISKYFQRTVFLGGLTQEDIENIILKRHRVSGYKLRFDIPEELLKSRKFKKQTAKIDPQEYCKKLLFDQLNDLGSGNITVTMLFWLSAIQKIEEDTLVVSSRIQFDYSLFYGLPSDELFTLAALLQHEKLNAEEHAMIFHQEKRQSILLINRMNNRGILIEKENGYYQINPLLYRPAVQTLKMKNLLH